MSAELQGAAGKTWRWSFAAIPALLLAVGWLHLGGLLLAILFSYFLLSQLRRAVLGRTWAAVALFIVLAGALAYGIGYFLRQTERELPDIVDKSVPAITEWAKQNNLTLPFTDYDSLKELIISTVRSEAHYAGEAARMARGAAEQIILLVAGAIVAMAMFVNFSSHSAPRSGAGPPATLNDAACACLWDRFASFYASFALIMGAQLIISLINTALTAVFASVTSLPHAVVIIGVTFLCGMLPVVGNLISNSIMVCIAFTVSPREALVALGFLVVVHKLEYFLNSKIIGARIHLPIWSTLLALVAGEQLMGVTGMILAPVVLHYARLEMERIPL
jgi:predicted PurR-regulated permease PerM